VSDIYREGNQGSDGVQVSGDAQVPLTMVTGVRHHEQPGDLKAGERVHLTTLLWSNLNLWVVCVCPNSQFVVLDFGQTGIPIGFRMKHNSSHPLPLKNSLFVSQFQHICDDRKTFNTVCTTNEWHRQTVESNWVFQTGILPPIAFNPDLPMCSQRSTSISGSRWVL
jgi:hypothetical protein